MKLFNTKTENRYEELRWSSAVPDSYDGIVIPDAHKGVLSGDFGNMIFQGRVLDGMAFWLNNYNMTGKRTFKTVLPGETLELNIILYNGINYTLQPFKSCHAHESQFNLTYTPEIRNTAVFNGAQECTTLDIHFPKEYLFKMVSLYPEQLLPFIKKMLRKEPVAFYPRPISIDQNMEIACHRIIGELSTAHPDRTEVATQTWLLFRDAITIGYSNQKRAELCALTRLDERKDLVRYLEYALKQDLAHPKTADELGLLVGRSGKYIKKLFREIRDAGVYSTWNEFRMNAARAFIRNHPLARINEVADTFGFSDVHNFDTAFKRRFGHTPTEERKRSGILQFL